MLHICGINVPDGNKKHCYPGPVDYPIPCILIAGKEKGKTILITAQIHSGEYPGTPATIRIADQIDPEKLKGNLIIFPCVNISGFLSNSNAYIPEDHGNLNGIYPGDSESLSGRIAQFFVSEIFPHVDYVLDLHSGGNAEPLTPCLFYPKETEQESLSVAGKLTIPYLIPTYSLKSETGYAGNVLKIPSLLLERGYCNYCKEEWIKAFEKDIRLCLKVLDMYFDDEDEHVPKILVRKMIYLAAEEDGLWFPGICENEFVNKGAVLGHTEDYFGNTLHEYTAEEDGIIMYYRCGLNAVKGHSLVAYAVVNEMVNL